MTDITSGPADAALPTEQDLLAGAAAAAQAGTPDAALAIWADLRTRFPDNTQGWLRAAELLTDLRRLEEAEALLAQAVTRFPDDFWLGRARAIVARLQNRRDETLTRYRDLRYRFPGIDVAWADYVLCLLEIGNPAAAEDEAEAALARFPQFPWLLHQRALCADAVGNHARAAERWCDLIARHPGHRPAYTKAIAALAAAGRYAEAAGLGAEALRQAPGDESLRVALQDVAPDTEAPAEAALADDALAAEQAGDFRLARALWAGVREREPANAAAHAGLARALLGLSRIAEATLVLAQARVEWPADTGLLAAWAEAAARRGDVAEAARRYQALRDAEPDELAGAAGLAGALLAADRLADAEDLLTVLPDTQANDPRLLLLAARVAGARQDWPRAIRRWTLLTARWSNDVTASLGLADALLAAGRWAEADAVLTDAVTRMPRDLAVALAWARCAAQGPNPDDAAARWATLGRRFADEPEIALALADSLALAGRHAEAEAALDLASTAFPGDSRIALRFANAASRRGETEEAAQRLGGGWWQAPATDDAPEDPGPGAKVALALTTSRDSLPATLNMLLSLAATAEPGTVPPIVVHAASGAGDPLRASLREAASLALLNIRVIDAVPLPRVELVEPVPDPERRRAALAAAHGHMSAVLAAFDDGAGIVASLPPGSRMFRATDLTAALRQQFRQGAVRYRGAAPASAAWQAAVRTVWPGLHADHALWRTDGLADNLPLFGKAGFQAFVHDLTTRAAPVWAEPAHDDAAWPIAARLRDGADAWGAYLAHRLLSGSPLRLIDLSAQAALCGVPPDAAGDPWQALRLTGYDRRLLRALQPAHVPLTGDNGFLALARGCLPAPVCLMVPAPV